MNQRTNKDIAEIFEELADLEDIRGGDGHRIRSFRRTAEVIERLPEPAAVMLRHGTLHKQRGIGEGSLFRIKEILDRGSCTDLDRLRLQMPPGVRQLLEIHGIGPRRARTLVRRMNITSVDALEAACRAGALVGVPSLGAAVQEKLLEAIARWRAKPAKMRLSTALRVGGALVEGLRADPSVWHAEITGSARRRSPLVGDLDCVAAASDLDAAVAAFVQLPGVADVRARGRGMCQVGLYSGHVVDLRVVPPQSWGAGLHDFSGSPLHVVGIRARGLTRYDVRIRNTGVYRKDDDALIDPCPREELVYSAVGLPWIPPELREDTGEIEEAAAGRLPVLLEASDLRGDLHMHTVDSDGRASADEMAASARRIGLDYLAITDHSKSLTIARGLDEDRLLLQRQRLRALEDRRGDLRVFSGIECDILADGSLDLDPVVLAGCDWVVGSVHVAFDQDARTMTDRLIRAMETGLVDVIGHPTGRMLGERDGYGLDFDRLFDAARRYDVALEVNGSPKRMDLDGQVCRAAVSAGVRLVVSTDAHAPEHMAVREFGVWAARKGRVEAVHVENTRPWRDLEDRRRARLRDRGRVVAVGAPPSIEAAPAVQEEALVLTAPLSDTARARLERFVGGEDDAEVEAALGENALAAAFGLLLGATTGPGSA